MAAGALGTDTGGSQPASLTGLIGLKLSQRARVAVWLGGVRLVADRDPACTRTVEDAARLLGIMAGMTRLIRPACPPMCRITWRRSAGMWRRGVGVPEADFIRGRSLKSTRTVHAAIEQLRALGGRSRSTCRTPIIRCPSITSSRPPKPAPTPRAATAFASGRVDKGDMWDTHA
ncbi:MAG: hypothetical protein IPK17_21965 [Chloroflexi bacterium]|uniref:amidase family protein n=1 Tax=Candidatus Flexifilum breve TaxID=3140694 RepID=UPI0031346E25|nr:hypothetical protein [Chloroflexota bacterium]